MEHTTSRDGADSNFQPYSSLDPKEIISRARAFADLIETKTEHLETILLRYESHEVVEDEISRTFDLLRNLNENEAYFKLRIGEVAAFLPRNQPLYAFTCFVIIPSFMASAVHFRIPHAMHAFFSEMLELLEIKKYFPNVFVSDKQRLEFLIERSALRVDPVTTASRPVTDVVIFTGTSHHASKLRQIFDRRTLFISNGSGHNPLVIAADANLEKAIDAVTTLQFYNQGQDCAAPNAILVHEEIYEDFMNQLRSTVSSMKIGEYSDQTSRIGPMSDTKDLVRIQEFLCDNSSWIDMSTPGVIDTRHCIVYPTIITKPLSLGANYAEIFAPIIFVQKYTTDAELASYFEAKEYFENAMYITLYGSSSYIHNLIDRKINDTVIHPRDTFLHNTHLHIPGVERGTQPYGGYGVGASSLSIGGKTIPLPTLPQRDIYEYVAKPMIEGVAAGEHIVLNRYSDIHEKNVQKIMRMPISQSNELESVERGQLYLDTQLFNQDTSRYIAVSPDVSWYLLSAQNVAMANTLDIFEKQNIGQLIDLIKNRESLSADSFKTALYAIPKVATASDAQNKDNQRQFFSIVYQLLFGKESGPKLTLFLHEADKDSILSLLDVI